MNNQKLEKIINIIHNLREEGEISGPPTNNASSVTSSGTPTIAGFPPDQPPVFSGVTYAKGGKGSRRWWLQYLNPLKKRKTKEEDKR